MVTVSDILADRLTEISRKHWPNKAEPLKNTFTPSVVEAIYKEEIGPGSEAVGKAPAAPPAPAPSAGDAAAATPTAARPGSLSQRLQLLEFSSYLESYLWPFFESDKASKAHVLSIVLLINQKFKEGVSAVLGTCSEENEVDDFGDSMSPHDFTVSLDLLCPTLDPQPLVIKPASDHPAVFQTPMSIDDSHSVFI